MPAIPSLNVHLHYDNTILFLFQEVNQSVVKSVDKSNMAETEKPSVGGEEYVYDEETGRLVARKSNAQTGKYVTQPESAAMFSTEDADPRVNETDGRVKSNSLR